MEAITVSSCRIQYPYIGNVCDYDFKQSDVCRNFKKLKILGVECFDIIDVGSDTARRAFDGQWYGWHPTYCYLMFNRWNGKRNVNCNHNDNDWNDNWFLSGVPASRNSLHFTPAPHGAGVFCFVSCPFHPPSILPTSSSGSESAAYFFVSSDLVSQSTSNRTFSVSSLRIASRTHGCFSLLARKVAEEIASIVSTNNPSTFTPSV